MKLLLIIPGAIGDFILTLPSIAWLRHRLEPSFLEIWAERPNLSVATSPGYADRAVALADTGLDSWPTSETVVARLEEFHRVISWRGAAFHEWSKEMRRRLPQMDFLPGFPPSLKFHAMDFRRLQTESMFGVDESFSPYPQIVISPEEAQLSNEYLAEEISQGLPIVMIHPGASGPRKKWGADHFARLVSELVEASNQVLLCEGPLDWDEVRELLVRLGPIQTRAPLRRVRIDHLMHLAAVIQRCQLFVGNDSGIGHLAAAAGAPTLSIFTVTDPRIWAPRGPRVRTLVCPSVSEVLEEASGMGPQGARNLRATAD